MPSKKSQKTTPPSTYMPRIVSGKGNLFVISGPSGAGKSALAKSMCAKMHQLTAVVTHTTRPIRPGEVDGVDYHFVTHEEVKGIERNGGFAESATVYGNRYGTSREEMEYELATGTDKVIVSDWQGARTLKEKIAGAVTIYILPPSAETLRGRLSNRDTDTDETIDARMGEASSQIAHYTEYDYLVVNDRLFHATEEACGIIHAVRACRLLAGFESHVDKHLLDKAKRAVEQIACLTVQDQCERHKSLIESLLSPVPVGRGKPVHENAMSEEDYKSIACHCFYG